jgi:hypothetical protein
MKAAGPMNERTIGTREEREDKIRLDDVKVSI